ncbi:DUF2603 domain-containing protein [Campylobacter sp. 19-13652]|uniref:DUF2603 domain-containing protein n=1 Tax=Campylobacter sp. 19-13652 TaxID=2840180 RepID=UPI001C75E8C8|nr:DUF2603 domain-containing protein [Campylobacter sp. 19-13652]BCX78999.1 UPF0763 protein [Campylobacter sp. 19-13652]
MNKIDQKIEQASADLGIKKDGRVVLEMSACDDENSRLISLKSGAWDMDTPWFVLDDGEPRVMMGLGELMAMAQSYKEVQKECFELKLEKSIWQNIPADFSDVWAVAMDKVKRQKPSNIASISSIDTDKLVRCIKKDHPNLFVDMNEIMKE